MGQPAFHSIGRLHQARHGLFPGAIVGCANTIIGSPLHALGLVGEFLKHVRAATQVHPDLLGLEKSALAERLLLAGICKVIAMATREQAATGIKLGHLPTTENGV
jgi:hypothetical protein